MKTSLSKEFIAGSFLLICTALLFIMAFTLGTREGILQKRFEVNVLFDDVGGLTRGCSVSLLGVYIGSVSDIRIIQVEGADKVRVALSIYERYRGLLRKGATFRVNVEGVMGPHNISVEPGNSEEPLDVTQMQVGASPIDLEDLAKEGRQTVQSLNKTLGAVQTNLEDFRSISQTLKRLIDRLEEKLIKGKLFKVF